MQIEVTERKPVERSFAIWRLGFRPFYLLGAAFAALAPPVWAARYAGWIESPARVHLDWHAHEMVFGYALAVIAGFLMTAVRNWTDQPTPTGGRLAALASLWLAARVLALTSWQAAAAAASAAFPLALAWGIAVPLVRGEERGNYFFVGLLAGLALADASHAAALAGQIDWPPGQSLRAALDIVLFILAVMGGRVIPLFTNNGVPGTRARRHPLVEKVALGSVLALLACDVLRAPAPLILPVLAVAALAHAARLALWQTWRTLRVPLVWILHAGYAWIPVHFALRALSEAGWIAAPLATHAATIGAVGTMTIGMMTRTARGHTGRRLQADRYETTAYLLVILAGIARVFGGLSLPALYRECVITAAVLWSAGFGIYTIRYWPILTRPRIDGRPG